MTEKLVVRRNHKDIKISNSVFLARYNNFQCIIFLMRNPYITVTETTYQDAIH